MKIGPSRLAAFAAVLVLLAGYLAVFRPLEASIAARFTALDDGRRLLDRQRAIAKRAAQLATEERTLRTWLAGGGLRDDRTATVNRFLRIVAAGARREGVRITAVTADAAAPVAPRSGAPLLFDETPLSITLRGTYARVLRLLIDLDRAPIAARIAIGALGEADRAANDPTLRATIRVTLLRADDLPPPDDHVRV